MDLERLQQVLREDCRLPEGATLLVGFSGGADSLCLLQALAHLRYRVIAAHYNHHLRAESDLDAAQACAMAERLEVEVVTGSGDVGRAADQLGLSVEEAARQMRYRFLFAQAQRCGALAVAVGHTADDQVETVLMHLLRGTGTRGLRGMTYRSDTHPWHTHIPLVRPLLHVWRSETEAYCEAGQMTPLQDASNQDTTYFRNRLRHELLPFLEDYNPQIRERLWRTAKIMSGDEGLLENLTRMAWKDCRMDSGAGSVRLNTAELRLLPEALARRVLRMAAATLRPGLRDIGYEAVERALDFVRAPTRSGQADWLQGLRLQAESDAVWIGEPGAPPVDSDWLQLPAESTLECAVPGSVDSAMGWRLHAEWADAAPAQMDDRLHTWLDADRLATHLQVRTRRAGDRFQPLGLGGVELKLKDFWINEKLPQRARDGWPLVCDGPIIVWIPGFRPAHAARLRDDTRRMVHLRVERTGT